MALDTKKKKGFLAMMSMPAAGGGKGKPDLGDEDDAGAGNEDADADAGDNSDDMSDQPDDGDMGGESDSGSEDSDPAPNLDHISDEELEAELKKRGMTDLLGKGSKGGPFAPKPGKGAPAGDSDDDSGY